MPRARTTTFAVVVLAGLAGGALWLSTPPSVPVKREPAFVLVHSTDPSQSLWIEVTSAQPVPDTGRISLVFEISGTPGLSTDLVIGGAFLTAEPRCDGPAFDLEAERIDRADKLWPLLSSYAQRRPGTGHLEGVTWRELTEDDAAATWADEQKVLVSRDVTLSGSAEKQFIESENAAPVPFTLATSTLTCTFERSGLVDEVLYRDRVRAPDVVVSQGARLGDGMMRVAYDIDMQTTDTNLVGRSTLGTAVSVVDDDKIVTGYAEDWWSRGATGDGAILQTGGTAVFEPTAAITLRSVSQLVAGVLATLAVAVASAAIASRVEKMPWAKKR